MAEKRRDKSRVVLRTGEVQRKDGTYQYSWQDGQLKRRFVYAKTLNDLREKEKRIQKDKCDGIKAEAFYTSLDELFNLWASMKRGLKNNTFENYKYMYNTFVHPVTSPTRSPVPIITAKTGYQCAYTGCSFKKARNNSCSGLVKALRFSV